MDVGTWVALVLSLVAVVVSTRSLRTDRAAFLIDVRQRWEELHNDWSTALIHYIGPDDYYSDATLEERKRVRKFREELEEASRQGRLNDVTNLLRSEALHARMVIRFMAYIGDAIVRGRITVQDAYAIFGPDVARHHEAIEWMAGNADFDASDFEPDSWGEWADQIPERHFHAEKKLVHLLMTVLVSERSRRGDTYGHLSIEVARDLHDTGRGARDRQRIRRTCRSQGAWARQFSLSKQLRHAEYLSADSLMTDPTPIITDLSPQIMSRRLLSRTRAYERVRAYVEQNE